MERSIIGRIRRYVSAARDEDRGHRERVWSREHRHCPRGSERSRGGEWWCCQWFNLGSYVLGARLLFSWLWVTEACCSLTDALVYVCYLPPDGGHRDDGQRLCVLHCERRSGESFVEFPRQAWHLRLHSYRDYRNSRPIPYRRYLQPGDPDGMVTKSLIGEAALIVRAIASHNCFILFLVWKKCDRHQGSLLISAYISCPRIRSRSLVGNVYMVRFPRTWT